jgi:hypothetical protein
MSEYVAGRLMEPLLTLKLLEQMRSAVHSGLSSVACSLDLQRSTTTVSLDAYGSGANDVSPIRSSARIEPSTIGQGLHSSPRRVTRTR